MASRRRIVGTSISPRPPTSRVSPTSRACSATTPTPRPARVRALDFLKDAGDPATESRSAPRRVTPVLDRRRDLRVHRDVPGPCQDRPRRRLRRHADWFETLARAERSHAGRSEKGLDSLKLTAEADTRRFRGPREGRGHSATTYASGVKRARRVSVGPQVTLVFENRRHARSSRFKRCARRVAAGHISRTSSISTTRSSPTAAATLLVEITDEGRNIVMSSSGRLAGLRVAGGRRRNLPSASLDFRAVPERQAGGGAVPEALLSPSAREALTTAGKPRRRCRCSHPSDRSRSVPRRTVARRRSRKIPALARYFGSGMLRRILEDQAPQGGRRRRLGLARRSAGRRSLAVLLPTARSPSPAHVSIWGEPSSTSMVSPVELALGAGARRYRLC